MTSEHFSRGKSQRYEAFLVNTLSEITRHYPENGKETSYPYPNNRPDTVLEISVTGGETTLVIPYGMLSQIATRTFLFYHFRPSV